MVVSPIGSLIYNRVQKMNFLIKKYNKVMLIYL